LDGFPAQNQKNKNTLANRLGVMGAMLLYHLRCGLQSGYSLPGAIWTGVGWSDTIFLYLLLDYSCIKSCSIKRVCIEISDYNNDFDQLCFVRRIRANSSVQAGSQVSEYTHSDAAVSGTTGINHQGSSMHQATGMAAPSCQSKRLGNVDRPRSQAWSLDWRGVCSNLT
jgi:hypothetical protein